MTPITVRLNNYDALIDGKEPLCLGTYASYGVEQMQIIPETGWDGLTITVTFSQSGTALASPVVVPESGIIDVPTGATAKTITLGKPGVIVFRGVSNGVQRITTNVQYIVADHGPVDGDAPAPEPSAWEQFVSQVKDDADRADAAASKAEDAAEKANTSAEKAEEALGNIGTSVTDAQAAANAAAQSAKDAAAELGKVQDAGTEAVKGIDTAKQSALTDISSAKDGVVSAVTGAGTTQTGKVESAGAEALKGIDTAKTSAVSAVGAAGTKAEQDIGTAKETALKAVSDAQGQATQAVQQAGTTEVGKVNDAGAAQTKAVQEEGAKQKQEVTEAGDAKLDEIKDANALLPTPTEADAGKAPIAQPDGTYALEQVTVDAYTKAESDARYAPIEAAIKVSGKGTGLMSLSPTVEWQPQGMKIYGRSWQDGTPSVETEVPIQDAGQNGQIDVSVGSTQLLKFKAYSRTSNGVTFSVTNEGLFHLQGSNESDGQLFFQDSNAFNNFLESIDPVILDQYYTFSITKISGNSDVGGWFEFEGVSFVNARPIKNEYAYTQKLTTTRFTRIGFFVPANEKNIDVYWKIQFSPGQKYASWKPYAEPQHLPVPTPDGLLGIPVDSGGNWTDENGQQWVSDVVDFAAGTKTQNVYKWFPSTAQKGGSGFTDLGTHIRCYIKLPISVPALPTSIQQVGFCNILPWNRDFNSDETGWYYTSTDATFKIPKANLESYDYDGFIKFCEQTGLYILYCLATPITTPLDAETVSAYKALQSYPGTTNIIAPDCGIEASALAEPAQYIDDKIQAAITQAVTQAVALTGGNA